MAAQVVDRRNGASSPWRLRDLSARDRTLAALVLALVVAPYVAALVRAHVDGWLPSGDAGMHGLFAFDVLHGHPPLLNTPTTSNLFTKGPKVHHPGPIQFYFLAVPMQLLGATNGMLAWTVFSNAASAAVATWAAFRRLGPALALWVAFAISAYAWSQGPAELVDAINSDSGAVAMLGLAFLAWAVADGDRRLLPVLALWSAYFTQLYLGYFPIGVGLTACAGVAVLVRLVTERRARSAGAAVGTAPEPVEPAEEPVLSPADDVGTAPRPSAAFRRSALGTPADPDPLPSTGFEDDDDLWVTDEAVAPAAPAAPGPPVPGRGAAPGPWWPWLAGAAAVTLATWAPVLIQAATGDASNLRLIWEYSRLGDRDAIGWGSGIRQVGHALSPLALVLRNDVGTRQLLGPLSLLDKVFALLVVATLVATVVRWWRRSRPVALLALSALAFAAIGTAVGAQVPATEAASRLGFFRWTFAVSSMALAALGAAVVAEVRNRPPIPLARLATPFRAGGIALLAVSAVASSFVAGPVHGREDALFPVERQVNAAVLAAVAGKRRVYLVPAGALAARSLLMPLALDLETHGHHVTVARAEAINYGDNRRATAARAPDVVVVVSGSLGPPAALPGKALLRTTIVPQRTAALARLLVQARSAPATISPDGAAMAASIGVDGSAFSLWIKGMAKDPARRLADDNTVALLKAGYLTSPKLDPADLQTLIDHPSQSIWGQDTVEVRVLTPFEYLRNYGAIR